MPAVAEICWTDGKAGAGGPQAGVSSGHRSRTAATSGASDYSPFIDQTTPGREERRRNPTLVRKRDLSVEKIFGVGRSPTPPQDQPSKGSGSVSCTRSWPTADQLRNCGMISEPGRSPISFAASGMAARARFAGPPTRTDRRHSGAPRLMLLRLAQAAERDAGENATIRYPSLNAHAYGKS